MKRLYGKNELGFALLWIGVYCTAVVPLRGAFGDESPVMLLGLAVIAGGILAFVKACRLEKKYGLVKWRGKAADYLFFLPLLVLTTGNLWGGVRMAYGGAAQVYAVLSMLLVGFIEELIFRGFLFRALLEQEAPPVAVTISAVTFGVGHIVNLLTGRGGLETLVQVVFAAAWGFLFTFVFYKSGSLLMCIAAHGLVDVFAKFAVADGGSGYGYITATVLTAVLYCAYLSRKPAALQPEAGKQA
ncbi:MAG: CPBP family intramembrane metalloprotease [Oscillospiraceae bacterium]|jgi:membrane protease YdiL (CAAX protease family)|nr:CPBP family intramembrane metalloprotease [Oscillospiraceae bacterium]